MTTLLLAEHDNNTLDPQTRHALTAAQQLGGDVHILVAGEGCGVVAEAASELLGVTNVVLAEDPKFAGQLAEPLAALIVSLAPGYDAIVTAATSTGKNVMPRVAALLDVMQVSDVMTIVSPDTFRRPIYAGNAIEIVQATDALKVLTVRASAFAESPQGGHADIRSVSAVAGPDLSQFVGVANARTERPDLMTARVVVAGGRPFGSKENFDALLVRLAIALNAAVGASRAAIDAGYASNDLQVGQTGKAVAPDLYIACGISGAIQHLAGMKESRVIVAINTDPDAPIFKVADYGLVGDIFQLVPELTRALVP